MTKVTKSRAQLQREIDEALATRSGLSRHHRYLLARRGPGGELRAGYLTPTGWHGDPLAVEDPKLRLAELREQPAPRLPRPSASTRRSHATKLDRAAKLIASYKPWTSSYSYEAEDRASSLANQLTDIDRGEGLPAPPVGYSAERYAQAMQVVRDTNRYGKKQQALRAAGHSHARKKKIDSHEAKQRLRAAGIDFSRDFHELPRSTVQLILDAAREAGYRKRKDAPGSTARMYFQHLSRLR